MPGTGALVRTAVTSLLVLAMLAVTLLPALAGASAAFPLGDCAAFDLGGGQFQIGPDPDRQAAGWPSHLREATDWKHRGLGLGPDKTGAAQCPTAPAGWHETSGFAEPRASRSASSFPTFLLPDNAGTRPAPPPPRAVL